MGTEAAADFAPPSFEEFEFEGWQRVAKGYHDAWGHVTGPFALLLLQAAKLQSGLRILDVGTGPGYAAALAGSMGGNVTGIDFSEAMVEEARVMHAEIDFRVGDVHGLEFADATFDRVFSNFGVQHFGDTTRAFREVHRVLRPGGSWAFTLWAPDDLNKAGEVLNLALSRHGKPFFVPEGPAYHELDDETALGELLAGAGFSRKSVSRQLVGYQWLLETPDELFQSELVGSVRSGARLRGQGKTEMDQIRRDMRQQILANYAGPEGYALPMAAYIITASKP